MSSRCVAGIVDRDARVLGEQHHREGDAGEREARIERELACASCSTIAGSAVVAEISDAEKITISSAGSARKPTIISRRAPSVPNAVPMSIAASARKTRAIANRPTSAIASAARRERQPRAQRGNDRRPRTTIAPNTT